MIMIETLDKRDIVIDKNEVLRYLGYGKNSADEKILEKIAVLTEKMGDVLSCKVCHDKFAIIKDGEDICFGTVRTSSKALKKNLSDCDEAIVFTATIGIEADRMIEKATVISPTDAVICQALGAVFIEALCDTFCKSIKDKFLRPRFSPGYGDFSIESQRDIFNMLDVPRKIGVTLTESLQMRPSKSVSAVIGIGKTDLDCGDKDCELCKKTDCQYRR